MLDALQDLGNTISDAMGEAVSSAVSYVLDNTIYRLFYYISIALCKIIYYLDTLYQAFTGQKQVMYDGDRIFLINVFFQNQTVTNAYWGMAIIGVVLSFAFAIIAVIRRMFDLRDKDQRSMGQILGSLGKTILTILSMNLIMVAVLNGTNLLMQQISYVFNNADSFDKKSSIVYTDEQYATMGRCLNTLGNYALNDSSNSRYNVNACFNAMRADLDYLRRQGVFDFYYKTVDKDGNEIITWQSLLQSIANSASLTQDLKADVYYESVQKAMENAFKVIRTNTNLRPLSEYKRTMKSEDYQVSLDRYLFLMATLEGARNEVYNRNPSLTDPIRGPFYYGEKDIYSFDQVYEDFYISIAGFNYLILWAMSIALVWDLGVILFSCVARIFNMLLLYLIAPLVFAAEPLDDGAKRKQWTVAFLVQSLGIFGTVIAMRVLMLFIPVVISGNLVISENIIIDLFAKVILLLGGFEVVKKASGLITGILADSAGWQSIQAGDMSHRGNMLVGGFKGLATLGTIGALSTVKNIATGNFSQIGSDAKSAGSQFLQSSGINELASRQGGGGGLPPSQR
ncbi:MAG: hypothetical protein IKS07_07050 [Lachnospiraceae bacterium]|nr:hypothetical protein [Lachnospiraceae bacterium]